MRWIAKIIAAAAPALAAGSAAAADVGMAGPAPANWPTFFREAAGMVDLVGFVMLTVLVVIVGMGLDLFNHLRVSKLIPESLLGDVQEEMTNGEYEKALEICEKADCLVGQVFAATLSKSDSSFERMEGAMRGEVRIQGLAWRQWVGQFRLMAAIGLLLGFAGAMIEAMRFVVELNGRPDITLVLASSAELRAIVCGFFFALFAGSAAALLAMTANAMATFKLEKVLLEAERLGEELLDPFRPLPVSEEE